MNWDEKRMFVSSMIDIRPRNKSTTKCNSRRKFTKNYYLKLNNTKERVCLKTFLGTLGIKEWTARYWLGESLKPKERSRTDVDIDTLNTRRLPPINQYIEEFLKALPKLPSHYCRKSSMKVYLEPMIQSKRELYRIYAEDAKEKSQRVGCVGM